MFFKNYRTRKQLLKENEELKVALEKEQEATFEEYWKENTFINTRDGLAIDFKGTELVKIFAASFWDLVADSDNYVTCDLHSEDKSVVVTIQKKGKLSPQDKVKQVNNLLERLLTEAAHESAVVEEAKKYLAREKEMAGKYV